MTRLALVMVVLALLACKHAEEPAPTRVKPPVPDVVSAIRKQMCHGKKCDRELEQRLAAVGHIDGEQYVSQDHTWWELRAQLVASDETLAPRVCESILRLPAPAMGIGRVRIQSGHRELTRCNKTAAAQTMGDTWE